MPELTWGERDDAYRYASTASLNLPGIHKLSAMTMFRLMPARTTSDDVFVAMSFRLPRWLYYETRFINDTVCPINNLLDGRSSLASVLQARICVPPTELGRLSLQYVSADAAAEMFN